LPEVEFWVSTVPATDESTTIPSPEVPLTEFRLTVVDEADRVTHTPNAPGPVAVFWATWLPDPPATLMPKVLADTTFWSTLFPFEAPSILTASPLLPEMRFLSIVLPDALATSTPRRLPVNVRFQARLALDSSRRTPYSKPVTVPLRTSTRELPLRTSTPL